MESEAVVFSSGGRQLNGVVTYNESNLDRGVVLLHPHPSFGGDMENHVVVALENLFLEEGFSTLRFNFRGTYSSQHEYSGVVGTVADTEKAIEFFRSQTNNLEVGIAGYSFGASTAIRVSLNIIPKFLVSLSASKDLILEDELDIGLLSNITCPAILFHGQNDTMIPPGDLQLISNAIGVKSENSVLVDGEGHFYQRKLSFVLSSIRGFVANIREITRNQGYP